MKTGCLTTLNRRCHRVVAGIVLVLGQAGGSWLDGAAPMPGDGPVFHATIASSVTFDDNLYLTSPAAPPGSIQDDIIFALLPTVELDSGDPELSYWNLTVTEGLFFYADHSDENDQLAVIRASAGTKGARSSLDFKGSFQQLRQNTRDIRAAAVLVRRDRTDLNLAGEYEFSPKTSIAGGLRYFGEDYEDPAYSDLRRVQMPVNVYYELTPRVDVSGGYRYQRSRRSSIASARYTDHFVNVGARGEFSPKITGAFKVGLTHRDTPTYGSFDTLGFEGSVRWEATVKIKVDAELSRDFDSSGQTGEPVKITDGTLRGTYEISPVWAAGASVRREWVDYASTRSDELSTARVFVNYQPYESFGLSVAWDYQFNHSNAAFARFEHNTFSVSGSYRY